MRSSLKMQRGIRIHEEWIHAFNPKNAIGLTFPRWITLKNLSFEHHDDAHDIATSLSSWNDE